MEPSAPWGMWDMLGFWMQAGPCLDHRFPDAGHVAL